MTTTRHPINKNEEMRTDKPAQGKSEPIIVAIPNTVEVKMVAIASLARAVESLAKALESTNVNVHLSNVAISGVETGIKIGQL